MDVVVSGISCLICVGDSRVHFPVDNVESVLRAFYSVGDELLSATAMADRSDPERLAFAREILDVTQAVLSRKMTQGERGDLLASLFGEAKALFTMSYHVSEFGKQHEQHATLGAEGLDMLKRVAVDRFRKGAGDGSLQRVPFLTFVLARYSEWAGKTEVQEYLRGLIETDQGLCDYLVGSMYGGKLDGWGLEDVLLGKKDDLMRRCKNMLHTGPAWLTEKHRTALESYLERFAKGAVLSGQDGGTR